MAPLTPDRRFGTGYNIMTKIHPFILIVFCTHALLVPSRAQDYIWQPGGTHRDLKAFQKGIDYSDGDFRGSHFWNMGSIEGVNLDRTNFSRSRFGEMSIRDVSFRGANLQYVWAANLDGTSLVGGMPGCDFTNADITGSDLPLNGEQLRSTKNYKENNLTDITIWGTDLSGTSFAGFNLTGARLLHCTLTDCDFTDADISRIAATGLTFDQIKTTKNYKVKDLGGTVFARCNFDHADFHGCKLSVFFDCTFLNADFTDTVFVKTNYREPRAYISRIPAVDNRFGFVTCLLTRQQFESTKTYRDKDLSRMLLMRTNSYAWRESMTPEQWETKPMNLECWNFRDCNLDEAILNDSLLTEADFTGASIQNTEFDGTNLKKEQWLATKTYKEHGQLMPPRVRGIDLNNYDFSGMTVTRYTFNGANLKNADFTGTTLTFVSFSDCDLTDTNFTDVQFNVVHFIEQSLTWEQFLKTQNGKTKDFTGIDFEYVSVEGWDFSKADLSSKRWNGCDYPDCVFDNSTIDIRWFGSALVKNQSEDAGYAATGLTREQFESTANYRSKVLNAVFRSCDLRGMDFTGFDLRGSSFHSTNLSSVRFDNARIEGCAFYGQDGRANGDVILTREQLYSTATYKSGTVENVKFIDMDLTGWDFSRVQLISCTFDRCIVPQFAPPPPIRDF